MLPMVPAFAEADLNAVLPTISRRRHGAGGAGGNGRCTLMRVIRATCALCGQQAASEDVPLTWMTSIEDGRKLLYCDRCARDNVRSIEGKLDSVYW
jgi:hypothetical protein